MKLNFISIICLYSKKLIYRIVPKRFTCVWLPAMECSVYHHSFLTVMVTARFCYENFNFQCEVVLNYEKTNLSKGSIYACCFFKGKMNKKLFDRCLVGRFSTNIPPILSTSLFSKLDLKNTRNTRILDDLCVTDKEIKFIPYLYTL